MKPANMAIADHVFYSGDHVSFISPYDQFMAVLCQNLDLSELINLYETMNPQTQKLTPQDFIFEQTEAAIATLKTSVPFSEIPISGFFFFLSANVSYHEIYVKVNETEYASTNYKDNDLYVSDPNRHVMRVDVLSWLATYKA